MRNGRWREERGSVRWRKVGEGKGRRVKKGEEVPRVMVGEGSEGGYGGGGREVLSTCFIITH